MKKVLCFGELLLRLSPSLQAINSSGFSIPAYVGGAELNVARALTLWNMPTAYCSALPNHALADQLIAGMEQQGIDTSPILRCGERVGLYFLPQGADLKSSGVIYDRAHSSFASLQRGMIDWDQVFQGVDWLHIGAITPALSEALALLSLEGLQIASSKNITISIDLNYRPQLWKYGKSPIDIIPMLMDCCDVAMGNIWSAGQMLGIDFDESALNDSSESRLEQAQISAQALMQRFPKCRTLAYTFRMPSVSGGISYQAGLYTNPPLLTFNSSLWNTPSIKDQAGSGDCFMAGLIYGLRKEIAPQEIIEFAAAAAFTKLQVLGDATDKTLSDIEQSLNTYESSTEYAQS